MLLKLLSIFIIFPFLTQCGVDSKDSSSDLAFRISSANYAGLTKQVFKPTIRVCYQDPRNDERHKEEVKWSILTWIEPLRSLTTEPLSEAVELVGFGESCETNLRVFNTRAYTNMGSKPTVNIAPSGWYGSKSVTLHEYGHAFGLLDTYNGSGGSCQPGQPSSVMCYAKFHELKDDDIAGIRAMYHRAFGNR